MSEPLLRGVVWQGHAPPLPPPPGLTFEEDTHTYRFGGRVVPSVTQLLSPLSGIDAIPRDILEKAGRLGTAIHLACELDDLGELDTDTLDPGLHGYLNAWRLFCKDHDCEWWDIEARVHSPQFGYAGTLDRAGLVKGTPAIVDIKSSTKLYASVGPQLAAYQRAYPRSTVDRYGVQLKPDGSYIAKRYVSATDWSVFASMATIYRFCAEHGISPTWATNDRHL